MVEAPQADRARRTMLVVPALLFAATACSPDNTPARKQTIDVVAGERPPAPRSTPVLRSPSPTPTAAATPAATVVVRRSFTDPPLPPELRDDGGLVPLPPRPPASAMATAMRPTFERAAPITTGEERP